MKDQIESYRKPSVIEATENGVLVRARGARANQALEFRHGAQSAWGRVVRTIGNEQVEVQLFNPPKWVVQAESVTVHEGSPSLPFPWDVGPIASKDLELKGPNEGPQWPPASVGMMNLSGERRPIDSGLEPLDLIAPIVGGGFNLIIDAHRGREAFDSLVSRLFDSVDLDVRVDGTETGPEARWRLHSDSEIDSYHHVMAAALAWIAHERQERSQIVAVFELPVVVAELGAQRGPAGLGPSSRIADAVASTSSCEVTCIVRLPASTGPDGFADIVETLALGDVDSQIFIDSRGRFEPARSMSSAPIDEERQRRRSVVLSALHQAERASDRLSLWGEDELSEEESDALSRAEALRVSLTGS